MNFLAHASLSGKNELVLVGNIVADSIKGNELKSFPEKMQKGILLHRFIDTYTDQHEVVMETKILLRKEFGHYAPVVADVFYDHFLAVHWNDYYPQESLKDFVQFVYIMLEKNMEIIPEKSKMMIPYMVRQDWLGSYITIEGISEIMKRMSRRTSFNSRMENAGKELEQNYLLYEEHFRSFFPDLREKSEQILLGLLK
jgi:acyl carrier protein phosphodiesterase